MSEKCHPSKKIVIHAKRSTTALLQNLTCSLQLNFPHRVTVILSGFGLAMACYKVTRWLLLLARGLQSVITYFCVDKFNVSEVSNLLSVLVNLVWQLHRSLMRCVGNSRSSETSKTDSGLRMRNIRLSSKKYLCFRIALNWSNHIKYNAFVGRHGAQRDFGTRSEKLWQLSWDHVFCYFRVGLFNTLTLHTFILFTYSVFWNSYVNLPIFSSDNINCWSYYDQYWQAIVPIFVVFKFKTWFVNTKRILATYVAFPEIEDGGQKKP